MQSTPWPQRLESTLLRAAIWALVGVIFGFIFVVFIEYLRSHVPPWLAMLAGSVGAAALTSLCYGSMRLTVMVANLTFVAMLLVTWLAGSHLTLESLVWVGALVGLPVGSLYGLTDKRSRVFCADTKIVAGAVAGLIGGAAALLIVWMVPGHIAHFPSAIVAPLAGLFYVSTARWFVTRCRSSLPPAGEGALVGAGVGVVTGALFMVMGGSLEPTLLDSEAMRAFTTRVADRWGGAVIASGMTCAVVGVIRGLRNVAWYDL